MQQNVHDDSLLSYEDEGLLDSPSDENDSLAGLPRCVPTTNRRVFIAGESHLGQRHYCTIRQRLEAAGIQVPRYDALSGGRYQDPRFADILRRNIEEIRADDVLLLVLGSNDGRDIAREQGPNTL